MPVEFWDMSPADFNALQEGYENKKHAEQELMRQQTYMIMSVHLDPKKPVGYDRFKKSWRFGWEEYNTPQFKQLTGEEIEAIKLRHAKYQKPKKR